MDSTSMNFQIRSLTSDEITSIPFRLTIDQLNNYGFNYMLPDQELEKCSFCGKDLILIGKRSIIKNTILDWEVKCDCDGYINNQQFLEEEKARKEAYIKDLEEKEAFRRKIDKLFSQSKLGSKFLKRTFENFNTDQNNINAYNAAIKYAESFEEYKNSGTGLMFSGLYGTGKTHLAAAIALSLLNRAIPVIFGTLISILGAIRQTYNELYTQEDELSLLNIYSTVDLLIIDDLGKEKPSEWGLEKLFTIINTRYENNKPIVFTTNYDIQALKKRLTVGSNIETAESIVSRLWEMCKGFYISGNDHRLRR